MIIFILFIFLFGLCIGSFLNCLIWRLHIGESMMGRSHCPKCGKQIEWYDNIPVLSFIILRGRCRNCHQRISWQYPLVELITGILFTAAFIINFSAQGGSASGGQFSIFNFQTIFNYSIFNNLIIDNSFIIYNLKFFIQLFRDWFIIAVMIVVFIYDLRWYLILDAVTLPACVIVFILNILLGINWQNLLFSGIIGGSFFLLQLLISRGKWIGGGDIRLGLLMGFALSWPNIITGIIIAYFIGATIGLILIISRYKKWNSKVPLGVFLSTSTVIVLLWGEKIIHWYWHFFV